MLGSRVPILRMRDDGHIGGFLRDAGGLQKLHFQLGDMRRAGRDLDGPRADPAPPDTAGDFVDIEFGDFFRRAGAPVNRQPHEFEVKSRGADDIHL